MNTIRCRFVVSVVVCAGLSASSVSAQVLGTFRWQFAPYCNTVTLTFQQVAGQFVANGFDDMCGAPRSAPAIGSAHLNPDGTVGLGITVIRGDGFAVQHSALFTPTSPSGTWTDDYGNSGTFAFGAASPSPGLSRPLTFRGGYGARGLAAGGLATATAVATISFGRALATAPAARIVGQTGLPTPQCPGSAVAPTAAPGFLCVYEVSQGNRLALPEVLSSQFGGAGFVDRFGAVVYITNLAAGTFGSTGTWALTLP